ncbi:MAG: hypothetical protein R6U40_00900 [Desulfobacterales bacterium]
MRRSQNSSSTDSIFYKDFSEIIELAKVLVEKVDISVLNLQKTPRRKAKIWEMNLEDLKEKGLFMPPVEKKYLELPV